MLAALGIICIIYFLIKEYKKLPLTRHLTKTADSNPSFFFWNRTWILLVSINLNLKKND